LVWRLFSSAERFALDLEVFGKRHDGGDRAVTRDSHELISSARADDDMRIDDVMCVARSEEDTGSCRV
jgi:hypothetical protein